MELLTKKEFILNELKELMFKMYMECHQGLYYEEDGEYNEEKSEAEWSRWQGVMEGIVEDEDEWLTEMENTL